MGRTPLFGIDLGTAYSSIARLDSSGRPVLLPNASGGLTTPSVVLFESRHTVLVGQHAMDLLPQSPLACVSGIPWTFSVPFWERKLGQTYRPQEIAALILRRLAEDARHATGQEVRDVVLTCPVGFGWIEREALKQAGLLAGLNVVQVVSAPVAAALADAYERTADCSLAICDLGAGTFDAAFVMVRKEELTVASTTGDLRLGGRVWDDALVRHLGRISQERSLADAAMLVGDPSSYHTLLRTAEECKKLLSTHKAVTANVSLSELFFSAELTQELFEALTVDPLRRVLSSFEKMIRRAVSKGYRDADEILLAGGSGLMPQLASAVEKRFRGKVIQAYPKNLVAKGAALFASDAIKISNIAEKSLGIVVMNRENREVCVNLLNLGDTIPVSSTQKLGTYEDGQRTVDLHLRQNEVEMPERDGIALGETVESGVLSIDLGESVPKETQIAVTLDIGPGGMLSTRAQAVATGQALNTVLTAPALMTAADLELSRRRIAALRML